jgi:hypothetical protein
MFRRNVSERRTTERDGESITTTDGIYIYDNPINWEKDKDNAEGLYYGCCKVA